jgi:phytanoyl-CoA hydroxylase
MPKLTLDQIRFFRDAGYLKLSRVYSNDQISDIKSLLLALFERPTEPCARDPSGNVTKLYNLLGRDELLKRRLLSRDLLDYLESLLGSNIEVALNRHNHAALNRPGEATYRLHRDILHWSRSLITTVIYLEETTIENGCTCLIPCSHLFPLIPRPNNGGTWLDEHSLFEVFAGQALPVPMNAGDVLVFDSLLFHSVGNSSSETETRLAVTLGFRSADELVARPDNRCDLVRGERIYKGNDRDRQK